MAECSILMQIFLPCTRREVKKFALDLLGKAQALLTTS
jgi:hypothetical protein